MTTPADALKRAYPAALAALIRHLGSLDAAEEALHDAVEVALARWPEAVPERPAAWLVRVARNRVIDGSRRRSTARKHAPQVRWLADVGRPRPVDPDQSLFRDDMLRLIFTCCHPALSSDSQVALTLHTVVGLSVNEIAAAYLATPAAMERRVSRARKALREGEIPYVVPTAQELPARRDAVCAVVLLIFNDGYTYGPGNVGLRSGLCELGIRLGRLLERLMRPDPEVSGLLAWMLLQHARFRARTAGDGRFIDLEAQDRSLWDREMITEGSAIVERALRRNELGPYQIQAALSAVHCAAPTFADTDWPQIVALYDVLYRYKPRLSVAFNRAIAVGMADGARAGVDALDAFVDEPRLTSGHLWHAARARFLGEAGDAAAAVDAYRQAIDRAPSDAERRHFAEQMVVWLPATKDGVEPS